MAPVATGDAAGMSNAAIADGNVFHQRWVTPRAAFSAGTRKIPAASRCIVADARLRLVAGA